MVKSLKQSTLQTFLFCMRPDQSHYCQQIASIIKRSLLHLCLPATCEKQGLLCAKQCGLCIIVSD